MGIFGNTKKKETATTPTRYELQKAMFLVGCAIAMADGEADDAEIRRMQTSAGRMPLFANNTSEEDDAVMHDAGQAFDENSKEAVGWATDILQHRNWAKAALCFMSEIIMADGEVEQGEMNIITKICKDLNVPIDEAQPIFDTFQTYYQPYEG